MSQRRTLILVAAIAIGALASFLVWNYVSGIQDDAYDDAERVSVYVSSVAIPKGTAGVEATAMMVKKEIPRAFLPSKAIKNLEDISGQVALSDVVANQVIVGDMFVSASDPAAQQSFSEKLEKIGNVDMVTVTVRVDDVSGVAGLIRPGDFVNVMVREIKQIQVLEEGATTTAPPEDEILFESGARYLYQKVQVLAIAQSSTPDPGVDAATAQTEGAAAEVNLDAGLVTLIVPARAAQAIASVEPERIYLSLVARDYEPTQQGRIDPNAPLPAEINPDTYQGEQPDDLATADPEIWTPYGPKGAVAAG